MYAYITEWYVKVYVVANYMLYQFKLDITTPNYSNRIDRWGKTN
jgi:hypothetical protein